MIPVARRVLGDGDEITLKMRKMLAAALFVDPAATLDDVREAVTTLEDMAPIARRVLGGAHPLATGIETSLREAYHDCQMSHSSGDTSHDKDYCMQMMHS